MKRATQTERVLAKAREFDGVCQVDFLAPNVCDGGKPITRVAARIFDLEQQGHDFECIGTRSSCKVYRLIGSESGVRSSRAVPPPGGPEPSTASVGLSLEPDSLFGVPRVKPERAHWEDEAA